jgi:anti-sigma factor RsiW
VSHLGVQISALVDGELNGAELDRANAHLAACERCRREAAELRQLKRDLRALAIPLSDLFSEGAGGLVEVGADEALTRRLLAMAGPGGPVPSRRLRREQHRRDRSGNERSRNGLARGRYVVWGALSLVVVGIGAAAFGMGGGGPSEPAPRVTPQLEMFSVEHAINSGDVPFPDPTRAPAQASQAPTRP